MLLLDFSFDRPEIAQSDWTSVDARRCAGAILEAARGQAESGARPSSHPGRTATGSRIGPQLHRPRALPGTQLGTGTAGRAPELWVLRSTRTLKTTDTTLVSVDGNIGHRGVMPHPGRLGRGFPLVRRRLDYRAP